MPESNVATLQAMPENPLLYIQQHLKAPKGQFNSFGNYNYRNLEDILEAVKPHLVFTGTTLRFWDEIVMVGDRYYVKSTIALESGGNPVAKAEALAREQETKKGMDAAQITGAASSYARKYAANALFCIDDTKDADSTKPESGPIELELEEPVNNTDVKFDEEILLDNLLQALDVDTEDETHVTWFQKYIEHIAVLSDSSRVAVLTRAHENPKGFQERFEEWMKGDGS